MIDNRYTALLYIDTSNTSQRLLVIINDEQNNTNDLLDELKNAPCCAIFMLQNTLKDTKSAITSELMPPTIALAMQDALSTAAAILKTKKNHPNPVAEHAQKLADNIEKRFSSSDRTQASLLCIEITDDEQLTRPLLKLHFSKADKSCYNTILQGTIDELKLNIHNPPSDCPKNYLDSLKENRTLGFILNNVWPKNIKENSDMQAYLRRKYVQNPNMPHNITAFQGLGMLFADTMERLIIAVSIPENSPVLDYINYAKEYLGRIESNLRKTHENLNEDLHRLNSLATCTHVESLHYVDLRLDVASKHKKLQQKLKAIETSLQAIQDFSYDVPHPIFITWHIATLLRCYELILQECLPASADDLLLLNAKTELAYFLTIIEELFIANQPSNNKTALPNTQTLSPTDRMNKIASMQSPMVKRAQWIYEATKELEDDLKAKKEKCEQLQEAREKTQCLLIPFIAKGDVNIAGLTSKTPCARDEYSCEYIQAFEEREKKLDEHKQILKEHEKESKEYEKRIEEHEKKSKEYKEKIEEHEKKSKEYKERIEESEQELEESEQELEESKQELKKSEQELEEYKKKLDEYKERIKESEQECNEGTKKTTQYHLANNHTNQCTRMLQQEIESQKEYYQLQILHEILTLTLAYMNRDTKSREADFMPKPYTIEDQSKFIPEFLATLDTESKQSLEKILQKDELKKFTLKTLSSERNAAAQNSQETKLPAQCKQPTSKLHAQIRSMEIAAASKQNQLHARSLRNRATIHQNILPTANIHERPASSSFSSNTSTDNTEYLPDTGIENYFAAPVKKETTTPKQNSTDNSLAGKIKALFHKLVPEGFSSTTTLLDHTKTESPTASTISEYKDDQMPQTQLYSINIGKALKENQPPHTVQISENSF